MTHSVSYISVYIEIIFLYLRYTRGKSAWHCLAMCYYTIHYDEIGIGYLLANIYLSMAIFSLKLMHFV